MKQIKQILLVMLACYSLKATAQLDSMSCTGAVGDVKWSLLMPDDFQKENGNCWIFMDGSDIRSSKLAQYGHSNIPDAQAQFLRCIELRQNDRIDADRAFGLPAGSQQEDALQDHTHEYRVHFIGSAYNGINLPNNASTSHAQDLNRESRLIKTGRKSHETRPKNIALYLYARIN